MGLEAAEMNQARYHTRMAGLLADVAEYRREARAHPAPYGTPVARAAAVLAYSGHPRARAAAGLLYRGALRPTSHPQTWTVASDRDPDVVYVVTTARCSCPWGRNNPDDLCKHQIAAVILSEAQK